MTPTIFGVILMIMGGWLLLRGSVVAMFSLVIFTSLFGGSAAFLLPALGGSSIPPASIALLFLIARVMLPGSGQARMMEDALRDNLWLGIFVIYGMVLAIIGPRLFADLIRVAPMRQSNGPLFASLPLAPTSQNLTTAFYMMGTLLCAIGSYVACRHPRGSPALVSTGIVTAWAHVVFGLISLSSGSVSGAILGFFRNAGYAQLNQEVEGVIRITGIQPEPSSFAILTLVWFVFLFECWALRVQPRRTGPVALALFAILIATTSTSGYVGLAAYGGLRLFIAFGRGSSRRLLSFGVMIIVAIAGAAALSYAYPAILDTAYRIYDAVISKKGSSMSAIQRTYWARQGLTVFVASNGIGIGPGSFRSSSIVTAIIGSTGIVGTFAFGFYMLRLVIPIAARPGSALNDERARIGIAATWAALSFIFVAAVVAASPDPTALFAIFAGASLGGRRPAHSSGPAHVARPRPALQLARNQE